jgi:hypothetical protein
MFSGIAKRSTTIFVGVFEAMLKIYYSTSQSLLYRKPSHKQSIVITGFLSNPFHEHFQLHHPLTLCQWKWTEIEPHHSLRLNGGFEESMAYVYTVVTQPI